MNSYNHYAYGAVCQWLFESVAGFRPDPDDPGLPAHHLRADDHSGAVAGRGRATIPRAGRIEAGWTVDGDRVTYDIVVPDGATRHAACCRRLHATSPSTARRSARPAATDKRAACSRPDAHT